MPLAERAVLDMARRTTAPRFRPKSPYYLTPSLACRFRFHHSVDASTPDADVAPVRTRTRKLWTPSEDALLLKHIHANTFHANVHDLARQLPGRSVEQVRRRGYDLLSGRLSSIFSSEEDAALLEIVADVKKTIDDPSRVDWKRVAERMNGKRKKPRQYLLRYLLLSQGRERDASSSSHAAQPSPITLKSLSIRKKPVTLGRFANEERRRLLEAVERYGDAAWTLVAEYVGTRSPKQCEEAWQFSANPDIRFGPWSPDEDLALVKAIDQRGTNWSQVSNAMRDPATGKLRTDRQCRQRAISLGMYGDEPETRPKVLAAPWSDEDDDRLLRLIANRRTQNKRWHDIALAFPGRSVLAVRIRAAWLQKQRGKRTDEDDERDGGGSVLDKRLLEAVQKDAEDNVVIRRRLRQRLARQKLYSEMEESESVE